MGGCQTHPWFGAVNGRAPIWRALKEEEGGVLTRRAGVHVRRRAVALHEGVEDALVAGLGVHW